MTEDQRNSVALGMLRGLSERGINVRDQLLVLNAATGALLYATEQLAMRTTKPETRTEAHV